MPVAETEDTGETFSKFAWALWRMKILMAYSGRVVIVLGRDAFSLMAYGADLGNISTAEPRIDDDLRRWRRSRDTATKSTRPSVVPTVLTKAMESHCPAGIG